MDNPDIVVVGAGIGGGAIRMRCLRAIARVVLLSRLA